MKAASDKLAASFIWLEYVMADDEYEEKRSKRWVIALVVPILYVLSIGPANGLLFRLIYHPDLLGETLGTCAVNLYNVVYTPLVWLCNVAPSLRPGLEWYVGLFH